MADEMFHLKLVVPSSQLLIKNITSTTRDVSHLGGRNEKAISSSYDRSSKARMNAFRDRLMDRMPIGNLWEDHVTYNTLSMTDFRLVRSFFASEYADNDDDEGSFEWTYGSADSRIVGEEPFAES